MPTWGGHFRYTWTFVYANQNCCPWPTSRASPSPTPTLFSLFAFFVALLSTCRVYFRPALFISVSVNVGHHHHLHLHRAYPFLPWLTSVFIRKVLPTFVRAAKMKKGSLLLPQRKVLPTFVRHSRQTVAQFAALNSCLVVRLYVCVCVSAQLCFCLAEYCALFELCSSSGVFSHGQQVSWGEKLVLRLF